MRVRPTKNRLHFILHLSSLLLVERGQSLVRVGAGGVRAERAELLEHRHEVEVVPRFNNLAVRDARDADTCNL
jgi:hypothetical protein